MKAGDKRGMMRVFIAAELSQEVLEALAETSALLRSNVKGRYVAPDSFHVTLAFLGEVPASQVDAAAAALEAGCQGFRRFGVSLGELGSFGKRSASTLWQGFDNAGDMQAIAKAVRSELHAAGFTFDEKAFKPHITLMRKADLTRGALPTPAMAAGEVSSIVLFKSDLSGNRPVYEPLHVVELL